MSEGVDSRREILTVVGPTAVGKTAVAIALARSAGGDIVSADSRQVYRGMDIGTAKPTADEQAQARHHLIDIVDPCETYDAVRYAGDAQAVIDRLFEGDVTPVVAGGTGFYLKSLFDGLFEGAGRFPDIREALTARADAEGLAALYAELVRVDPGAADGIHENDRSRIIRALEVFEATGRRLSEWHSAPRRQPPVYPRYVGLSLDRDRLREKIDRRVDAMMEAGLLEEIEALVGSGVLSSGMPAASAVGYRELLPIVERGDGDLAEAIELIKRNTKRYAKRQMTWFKSMEDVAWFDVGSTTAPDDAARAILASGLTSGRSTS